MTTKRTEAEEKKKPNAEEEVVVIQEYKLTELARIYHMTKYRLRLKLAPLSKKLGKRKGHYYTPEQVTKIFKLITLPSNVRVIWL